MDEKLERRLWWNELNASWNVEPQQVIRFASEKDKQRAFAAFSDPGSPLFKCPHERFRYVMSKMELLVPELAITTLGDIGVTFTHRPARSEPDIGHHSTVH